MPKPTAYSKRPIFCRRPGYGLHRRRLCGMVKPGFISLASSCGGKILPPGSPREQGRDVRGVSAPKRQSLSVVGHFVRQGGYFGGGGLVICLKFGGRYIR